MSHFFSSVDFWGLVIPHCDLDSVKIVFQLNTSLYKKRFELYDKHAERLCNNGSVDPIEPVGKLMVFGHALKHADQIKTFKIFKNGYRGVPLYGDVIAKIDPPNVLMVGGEPLKKSDYTYVYGELVFVPPYTQGMGIENTTDSEITVNITWRYYHMEKREELLGISFNPAWI
jgi:hypothetical protein